MKHRKQFMALSLAAVLALGGVLDPSALGRVHAEEPTGQEASTTSGGDSVSGNQGAEDQISVAAEGANSTSTKVEGSFDFETWLPAPGDTVVPAGKYGDEVITVELFGKGMDYKTGTKPCEGETYNKAIKTKDKGPASVEEGKVPEKGALKITSTQNAEIMVVLDKTPGNIHMMCFENGKLDGEQVGTPVAAGGTIALSGKEAGKPLLKVEAGKDYYLWSQGENMQIWNISYSYQKKPQETAKPEETAKPQETAKPTPEPTSIPAFPGAEGGGMYATGGRAGDVYVVTNLEDDGEGSLRYGIANAPAEGRIIVFDIGGTINLKKRLSFSGKKNITIAGQTAPGDGITIAGYDTDISNSENLIIRFVRFRVGTENLLNGGDSMDALWGRDNKTFIIDHCTFSWNTDETLSTYRGKDGTVQWCIVSESLTVSGHSKGRHGYGGIFGGNNTVFQYNLLTNHTSRNPRIGGGSMNDPVSTKSTATLQLSNNVLYNHGYYPCYGGGYAYTNYINNYVKLGRGSRDTMQDRLINVGEKGKVGGFYVNGNILEGNAAITADNSKGIKYDDTATTTISDVPYVPTADAANPKAFDVTMVTAAECYDKVLNSAGATYPHRDAVDARVVTQVKYDTGFYINTPDEVGGYPARTVTAADENRVDTDHDGIPDAWESDHSLNPNDASDSMSYVLDKASENYGYTWLEVYMNELVAGVVAQGYEAPNPEVNIDLADNTLKDEGQDVTVTATAIANNGGSIAKVEFYNGDRLLETVTSAPYTYTYTGLTDGTYNISARGYDNEGNATQSTTSKLHVNSTAGVGEDWTSADIGNPAISGTASLEDGVLTVKGAGKLGRWEGSVLDSSPAKMFDTTDDFQYVYRQFTGDGELVAKVDYILAVDQHSFNGLMFRESLDNDAATAALGLTMTKIWDECNTVWTAFMPKRDAKGGNMSTISSSIDSSKNAQSNGIPAVSGLNFKSGNDYNGTWLKLTRLGNTFTGSVSEDGLSWKYVGEITVQMPETVYVGFAVEANKVANRLENYGVAKFSNISTNTELGLIAYELENVNCEKVKQFTKGKDLMITLTNVEGYLLPETVEVTVGGKAVEAQYDREKGTVLIKAPTEDIVIKAQGVERVIAEVTWEEVDPGNLLTVEEKDGKIILTQTAESGSISSGIPGGTSGETLYADAVNESWILFPEVSQSHQMSLKLKVTKTLPADGKNDKTGVFVGLFNSTEGAQAFESVCFRPTTSQGISPYWTKTNKTGNGNPKSEFKLDTVYTIDFTYDGEKKRIISFWEGDTSLGTGEFKASNSYLFSQGLPVRYGIGLIGATAEVTDLKLIDNEGNVIYDQNEAPVEEPADYTAVDAALEKVSKLNPDNYVSFEAVEKAVAAVERELPKSQQEKVDAFAKAIEDAIGALEKKPEPSVTPEPGVTPKPDVTPGPDATPAPDLGLSKTENVKASEGNLDEEIAKNPELKAAADTVTKKNNATAADVMETMKQDIVNRVQAGGQEMVKDNVVVQEISVAVSRDGGKTWKPVTAKDTDILEEGITLVLPYPSGTNRDDFDFLFVTHLITMGPKAGTIQNEDFELTDEGLKVTVHSASPFAIGYAEKSDDDDDGDEDDGPEETADDKSDNKANPAKTGDHMGSFMWMWTVVLFIAAAGIASILVVRYRRKK